MKSATRGWSGWQGIQDGKGGQGGRGGQGDHTSHKGEPNHNSAVHFHPTLGHASRAILAKIHSFFFIIIYFIIRI